MNELSKRLADLSPEKQALLVQALQNTGALNAFPLSFAQQRLWFLDQLAPGSPAYNLSSMLRLTGPLDCDALEAALQGIIRRHEVLRTTFLVVGGQPIQVAQPQLSVGLATVDLRQVPADAQDDALQALAQQEARRPFHLAAGPLLRATLLRLAPEHHTLLLTAHHTVADGWSLAVFWRELAELYAAARHGRPSQLPELTTQYADYARWQRQWLQGQQFDALMSYWRAQLDGAPALLSLPTDHARAAQHLDAGAQHALRVPPGLAAALDALSRRAGATLFMTLLAAFQVLLARYSGQDDIVVGTPVAGRTRAETEGLIGCFVNTLALRTDLSGDPTFHELLGRVRGVCLNAYAHQDLPFELLVEALRPERDLGYAPLAQVMLAFQNTPPPALELDGLALHPTTIDAGTAKFDLTLDLSQGADGLDGYLEYRTDLFDAATIARMAGHFLTLLESITTYPNLRISALPLLTAAEQRQQLVEWNATTTEYPHNMRLHQLFEAQAARTPDSSAVVFEDQQLTYGELNRRANQLAHHLRRLGIGPDTRVGIHLERSLALVVALLAILKAGGAYLPLDPDYPAERLRYMLEDAQVAVLLTGREIGDWRLEIDAASQSPISNLQSPTLVYLDTDWEQIAQQPATTLESGVAAEDLAYIIYTSGSTGRPKGTMIPHRAIVNHLCWMQATFPLTAADRIVQNTSFSFDVSVWEFLGPLAWGAQLVLPPPDERHDSTALLRTIRERQVTILQLVPALLAVLLDTPGFSACASLRHVFCGGEALPFELQERFLTMLAARLHHMYGPTETAIDAVCWSCERGGQRRPLPIGRPLGNVLAYVLDVHMQPAPIGVPGELYIGGAGLARGYLNRPELTAERFIPNPFAQGRLEIGDWRLTASTISNLQSPISDRLYRTGDLARYREDGAIEFLGRLDQQIKLRGFRIELGEIEVALAQHGAVREAVVVARGDGPGERRLVAYVVPRDWRLEIGDSGADNLQSPISNLPQELRQFLLDRLPDYMIPAAFVLLEALPLTPNGKLDRAALPAVEGGRSTDAAPLVAPRSPVEELLLGIWSQLLGREQISIHDNFFELGGHSLLATQVVARLRQTFQLELPLRSLFEAPTIAELAQRLEAARQTSAQSQALPLLALARPSELPLSFAQQRLWFLHQLDPHSSAYHLAITLRVTGALNLAALRHSLDGVVRRHQVLRTTFSTVEGRPVQLIAEALSLRLPLVDLQALPPSQRDATLRHLLRDETQRPFDLVRGPLVRACLFRLEQTTHVLAMTLHHIVTDGWSMAILIREIGALYASFCTRQGAPLAPLPLQYADYALWQQRWLQGAELEAQLSYWRQQLAGSPAMLELPTDYPRPAIQSFRGATQTLHIPKAVASALQSLSRREGVTLFMTLLAAFQVLLYRYSGQSDIVVGTPIANRHRLEVEELIGFFVNTLVLRSDLAGNPTFRSLLSRVREVTLQAYAHQDVPFEKLVEELHPQRSLSHTPLFQVMLALQNTPLPPLELPGLTLERFEVEQETAKFDLLLSIDQAGDGLNGSLEYNTELFDSTTIAQVGEHWQRLLAEIVAAPDRCLDDFTLLSPTERRQLLLEWNATTSSYPRHSPIHSLFEQQVERTPDALAAVFDHGCLTYRELNRRANQLAYQLRSLGVGPETRVGVSIERSLEQLAALLGILKAGGAYVPLDPTYPPERLRFILADARVAVLLTSREMRDWRLEIERDEQSPISNLQSLPVIAIDAEWETIARQPHTNPDSGVTSDNLAYVCYTSGSTGTPKGVGVMHHNVVRLVHQPGYVSLSAQERVLAFAPLAFDAATFEVWGCLLNGALVVISPPHQPSLEELGRFLGRQHVTTLWLTAGLFHQMVDHQLASLRGVRQLLAGGDVLSVPRVERLLRELPGCRLINGYGPTENTTFTCCYPLAPSQTLERSVPIGRPIENTQVYILDGQMRLVPRGVAGELYIGGDGLARGYLDRPDLTAERFVPNPFAQERLEIGDWRLNGAQSPISSLQSPISDRLYRTGDLARYLPDGNIEFLGRKDHQVKLRGFRIELGEIEAVLHQHPAVREAVVVVSEDGLGERRLVAYIVPGQEQRTKLVLSEVEGNKEQRSEEADSQFSILNSQFSGELRQFLRDRLPDYMIPATFVFLEALPLTPNGKLDRRALPAVAAERPTGAAPAVAPRTPTEEMLLSIWQQLLGRERISVHDNFFELGGHSLLATQLVARLRQTFQIELPLRSLFEAPSIAELAQRLEAAGRTSAQSQALPLLALAHPSELPLSFAQQRLWFLHQLDPDSSAYHLAITLRVTGALNLAALRYSLDGVVRRHQVLRTTFSTVESRPVQVIAEPSSFRLPLVDLQALSPSQRDVALRHLLHDETQRPFDLARGPLLRVVLFRLEQTTHVLALTLHHIVTDGWSMAILIREIGALYASFGTSEPAPLAPLPLQYADYALWQQRWLQGAELEAQLSYWRQQLAGSPAMLELPTDHPRPAIQSFRGATQTLHIPKAVASALQSLSRREGVTLFMTLLAAFQVLLYRYSGQSDIVVGTPIANRHRLEVEELIGFFVNTLVLHSDLAGNPTFRSLLARVREVTLQAYAHQDVPFEKLVEELHPQRSLSHTPLFQVMLALQNTPLPPLELPGLILERFEVEQETAKFDLLLSIDQAGDGLNGSLEYNTELFDPPTIERLLTHWQTLLAGVINDPDCRVSALPLLTDAEREQMLIGWNATAATYLDPGTLHQLFEAQAARTPDAIALVWAEQRISYQALNQRANQLARHLRRQGVGPEALVGVCLHRSLEMVIAVLGILKAGAAYVPLDPAYPPERLDFMLADSRVAVLLTRKEIGDWRLEIERVEQSPISNLQSPTVVHLDADWPQIAQEQATNLESHAAGENLAYVIYTSGSTGRPKGVAIAHQSAVNLVRWAGECFSPTQLAGVLAATSLCFDLSVFELFVPLCRGGKVLIAENALELPMLVAAAEVTLVNTVPSAIAELVRMGGLPGSVSTVTLAGEPLPRELVEQLYQHPGIAQVYNLYAPSETTTYSTFTLVPSGERRPPSIGRPLANTQIYVLDAHMQPVPIGVPGELYIGGAGVARGYLGRPELTAERFIPNPFAQGRLEIGDWRLTASTISNLQSPISDRLYRTGDLARYRADGTLEFLGRADHQVKLRGFRIELGEIEAVLRQSPAVDKCVVVAREDVPGMRRLVAYVVMEDWRLEIRDSTLNNLQSPISNLQTELRDYLKTRLPDYMIPAVFVILEDLPRTPNGKLDRAALPADIEGLANLEGEFAAPRTPTEELLAAIWADVLGREYVGAHDHFFDLGGHSLLATRVISQARETFQVDLPLRELFEAPTVAALAQRIAALRGSAGERLPLRPAPRNPDAGRGSGPVPLSFAQQRLWLLDRFDPGSPSYTIASAVRLAGPLDIAALQGSLNAVVERHEALRTTFTLQGEQPVQVIAPALTVPLPIVDLRDQPAAAQERRVQELGLAAAQQPFDLERGPLLRATLLRRADENHVLLLMMHHIVADGWSIAVLIREVATYYPAYRGAGAETSAPTLPPLPVQFTDYALWQRQWLQGETLERQRAYWKERLSGYLPTIELPVALPRPATLSFQGAQHSLAIPKPLTAALADLSRREHMTMFMTLLAAFAALLHRYTGEEDIVVGSPIANRTQPEIEGLIGFFVNMLALRIDLAGNPSFRALLRRVRETCLEAYAYQDMPFDQVVEAVQPWQNASRMPLFNVVLVLQNVTLPPLELPDLAIELLEVETNTAKYDLTLTLTETPAGLRGALEYRTDLFDAMTIARLLEHFQTLLAAAATDPDRPILALPLVTEDELRLLDEWSGART